VSVASIVLLTLIAQTAPPDLAGSKKAVARDLLVKGQALYERGDYAGALGKFNEAYATFPSPKIWFNIGNASVNLGRDLEALEAFESFLRLAADEPADRRNYADKQVAKLKRRLGQLSVECNMAGAEIRFDGEKVGVTPLDRPIWATPGRHQVVAARADAAPAAQEVMLSAGRPRLLQLELQPVQRGTPPSEARAEPSAESETAEAHAAKAKSLYQAGDYAGAIAEMEAERRISSDPGILYNIGQAYRRWGMREQAIIAYRQYLDQVPQAGNRQQVERHIAELQGSLATSSQRAAPPVQPAAAPAPARLASLAQEHERRARLLYRAARYEEAIDELEAEYVFDARPIVLYNIGQAYRFWGKPEQATRAYRHYLAQAPQAGNRQEVERVIAEIQDFVRRRSYWAQQPSRPATSAQEHARRANILYQAGSFAEAVGELEAEYFLDGDPNVLYNLGQAYRLWGKLQQAVRAYRHYLVQQPQAPNRQQVEKVITDLRDSLASKRPAGTQGP
jgi:tetratricopeptide (TPR) repeat protein